MSRMWKGASATSLLLPVLSWMVLMLQGCDLLYDVVETAESGSVTTTTAATSSTSSSAAADGDGTTSHGNSTTSHGDSTTSHGDSTTSVQIVQMRSRSMVRQSSVPLSATSWSGGVRLLMEVSPLSADGGRLPSQKLVVDTGSATLAFCQSSFIQEAAYKPTKFISCNQYNPGGSPTGYWGPFVVGQIYAGNLSFSEASYSIMADQKGMPCVDGMQGIFGIAFQQLDIAYNANEKPDWASGKTACPQEAGVVPPPLLQKLNSDGGAEKIGIYWSGKLGDNEGMLYLDADAELNEHYRESAVLGPAVLGEVGWYDVSFQKISVGDQDFTNLECSPSPGKQCIMDTGTPGIVVPSDVFDHAVQLAELGRAANLTFWLPASSGQAVPVTFDLLKLMDMGAVGPGAKGVNVILGLPLWASYYTLFNIKDQSVSFVAHKTPASTHPQPQAEPQPSEPSPGQSEPPAAPIDGFPFGPGPWTGIPGHQAGAWPSSSGDPWPTDPFGGQFGGPFGIFRGGVKTPTQAGSGGRRMAGPLHV